MPRVEQKLTPLFKSNFSIGKSILTLDAPEKDNYPNGPKSIFSILKENSTNELVLLEDNFYSFYTAYKYCLSNDIDLKYGISINFCENLNEDEKDTNRTSKICVFIKNKNGYGDLIKLNSIAVSKGYLLKSDLESYFTKNLKMAIPFYDSFVHKNALSFGKFSDFLLKFNPSFFIEDNLIPFDRLIKKAINDLSKNKYEQIMTKTICYYQRSDIDAYLTYKCICNRGFRSSSLSKPNFDHFSSSEFCWEAIHV